MNIVIKIKWYSVVAICCILFAHCTQSDDYKNYMPDGEIIYPQKPDSVKTYPGKNRIQLEWVITDPKVTSCKVLYEQDGIQEETTVPINNENDTTRLIVYDLKETTCKFNIISFDDFGHTSIPVEVDELAYGEVYEQMLSNRMLKNFVVDENSNELTLEWYNAIDDTELGIELTYTDINDSPKTMFFTSSETSTILSDFKFGAPLYISTMYKPVPSAIDTFPANSEKVDLVKIVNVVLNKPVTSSGSATSAYTGMNAVDGDRTSSGSRWISPGTFLSDPQWLEVDLQGYFKISGFGMWRQDNNIEGSQKFSFQVWYDNEWIDVITEENNVMQEYHKEFNSVTTNRVRLYIHPTVSLDYMIRLFEIEVYSTIVY
uniref:DUF4998 domain-containing protein n=1 Tax=uncultured Draconibacterium sp. TaxID=1573823 RepID=UPI0032168D11